MASWEALGGIGTAGMGLRVGLISRKATKARKSGARKGGVSTHFLHMLKLIW
jgi:hypothetical protein